MGEENPIEVAIAALVSGLVFSIFFLVKIGAVDHFLSDNNTSDLFTRQMQTGAAELDLAQIDEQRQDPPQSHAPASKSDRPE